GHVLCRPVYLRKSCEMIVVPYLASGGCAQGRAVDREESTAKRGEQRIVCKPGTQRRKVIAAEEESDFGGMGRGRSHDRMLPGRSGKRAGGEWVQGRRRDRG